MREKLQQLIDTNEFEFLKTMSEEDIWKFAFAIFYTFSDHEERTGHQRAVYQDDEIKDIKDILTMFAIHIRSDGRLYPFDIDEIRKIYSISNNWLSKELEKRKNDCWTSYNGCFECGYDDDDLISRQAVEEIKEIMTDISGDSVYVARMSYIRALPSVTAEQTHEEWCTDCKEYDQEQHCCHRFCKVIRETVDEIKQAERTGHWIYDRTRDWDGECKYECSECGMGSDVDYTYCMRCGAKMFEPQERSEDEA